MARKGMKFNDINGFIHLLTFFEKLNLKFYVYSLHFLSHRLMIDQDNHLKTLSINPLIFRSIFFRSYIND